MKAEDTRDQAIERLLQGALQRAGDPGVSPDCLDAETFAAWTDGTLDRSALAHIETHVADCARCQSMAAVMMRAAPAQRAVQPWWQRSFRSTWLVPLTAGAAAVALWAVLPNWTSAPPLPASTGIAPSAPSATEQKASAPPALTDRLEPLADRKDAATGGGQAATERRETSDERPQAPAKANAQAVSESRQAANEKFKSAVAGGATTSARDDALQKRPPVAGAVADAAAAPPPIPVTAPAPAAVVPPARAAEEVASSTRANAAAGSVMKQEAFAPREVASPDPAVRWRLGAAGLVERTEDGGHTWTRLATGVAVDLIAGASPSPLACWVVGRNGTVLRSIDGRNWVRASAPDSADLVAVEASDASTAVVTTSDGRRFRTSNGGQGWSREPLQDF